MNSSYVLFAQLVPNLLFGLFTLLAALWLTAFLAGIRYIPHRKVGIIEKLWSPAGSLTGGGIIALRGEAGFQAQLLRGGIHFGYQVWVYRIHMVPLVDIPESRIGYVYARDGEPLGPSQTLGRSIECNGFQDATAFLQSGGQRGRQRMILREGVYAINTALFIVITESAVHAGPVSKEEATRCLTWQRELSLQVGFAPVIIGSARAPRSVTSESGKVDHSLLLPYDEIGVVTVHDGPSMNPGEFIAPLVEGDPSEGVPGHNYFQDAETFVALMGRRGKQLQVLTDGTYFINRWFATLEMKPKTLIPIGYVGVVISYYGNVGSDVSGSQFRYGEQVESGERGVWRGALAPGKYALNPFALKVELVPTVNFVLRWISGQVEAHRYDEQLTSIAIITADGYEPVLPLSLVLHIDYEKAPNVVQRFGDVRRLITQTLDPILTAYFRDVAQTSNMLDLLTNREAIQRHATEELGRRFQNFDINCVAVLIGRPESSTPNAAEDPIDRLFDQLRQRRLAEEQKETFAKQQEAAVRMKELNHACAEAEQQAHLTQTKVQVEIAKNRGAAELAEAEGLAKRDIAMAEGRARASELTGQGESSRIAQIGQAEAEVSRQKVAAYGDPRLYALHLVATELARSAQPLVPAHLVAMGSDSGDTGLMQTMVRLMNLLPGATAAREAKEIALQPQETV